MTDHQWTQLCHDGPENAADHKSTFLDSQQLWVEDELTPFGVEVLKPFHVKFEDDFV